MSEKHTPGRLGVFTVYGEPELRDDAGNVVAFISRYNSANARRLAACWNACEGLETEQLEQFGLGKAVGTEIYRLRALRYELLDALEYIEHLATAEEPRDLSGIVQTVRDAIIRAKGGAG